MTTFIPFILPLLAGLSTLLGCIPIFFKIKGESIVPFALSMSISIMILLSIFELVPQALTYLNGNMLDNIFRFSICFLIGYIVTKTTSLIIEKREKNKLYSIGVISSIALMLHNIPEGILTFIASYNNYSFKIPLTIAIALHNIPEGISIAIPVYYAGKGKGRAVKLTLLSALAEPLGALIAYLLFKDHITNTTVSYILIIVSGIMITLSIESMFPEIIEYKNKKPIYLGLIIGLTVFIISKII